MHTVARAEAHSDYCLHHLTDPELLASTRGQVGRSNQILAALLAHLAEVEARGLHRSRACSSLYTYCIYELRMSEDAALRRVHAARILRRFPVLYERIAAGELHLTAVLTLGPHLTETNHLEVLARAKYRTKKEVQALVRQLDPLPDVPACVEPLGPPCSEAGKSSLPSNPSPGKWLASLCGPVRELRFGERPTDWVAVSTSDAFAVESDAEQGADRISDLAAWSARGEHDLEVNSEFGIDFCVEQDAEGVSDPAKSSERREPDFADPSHVAERGDTRPGRPESLGSLGLLGPQRYKVQFTASQEYVDLLEEARDLLAHAMPNRALDEVHLRALRLLVAELKKRKYALTAKPRAPTSPRKDEVSEPGDRERSESEREPASFAVGSESEREPASFAVRSESEREPASFAVRSESERERGELRFATSELALHTGAIACGPTETMAARRLAESHEPAGAGEGAGNTRWRGRYVPAAVRRAVAERDCERCAYVDEDGRRCRETSGLEFHHLEPHACGGPPTVANLSLRCRAHNGLAAEQDFGREFMAKRKQKETRHPTSAPSK